MSDWKIGASEGRMKIRWEDPAYMFMYGHYDILATDYDTYAIMYTCKEAKTLTGKPKRRKENLWLLTRHPFNVKFEQDHLDVHNLEFQEFMRIKNHAIRVVSKHVPDFRFDAYMRPTIQGERRGCLYPDEEDLEEFEDRIEEPWTVRDTSRPGTWRVRMSISFGGQLRTIVSNQPLRPMLRSISMGARSGV